GGEPLPVEVTPFGAIGGEPAFVSAVLDEYREIDGPVGVFDLLECLRTLFVVGNVLSCSPGEFSGGKLERLEVELFDINPVLSTSGKVEGPDDQIWVVV
ncbi:uncharacterized protein METZ01_LOCUS354824, partial [marine metagenome]